jgi:hypothetical protein
VRKQETGRGAEAVGSDSVNDATPLKQAVLLMKSVAKSKKRNSEKAGQAEPSRVRGGPLRLPRWVIACFCLLLGTAATWAFCELVLWNKLPADLVGKWVVEGGPQDGATFDFYRNGTLEAHLNHQGLTRILKARVTVEDNILLTTTKHSLSGQEETRRCVIRVLSPTAFVVEFEKGEVWNMVRVK